MSECLYKTFNFSADPIELVELFKDEPFLFLLNSNQHNDALGRYSFIGFDPFYVHKASGKDSLKSLKENFSNCSFVERGTVTPLAAGIVGFLSYDYGLYQEKVSLRPKEALVVPDCLFGFYDCILTIDHWHKKLHVSSSGLPERNMVLRQKRAQARLDSIVARFVSYLSQFSSANKTSYDFMDDSELELASNFSKQQYLTAVKKALSYIKRGDVYQVNLSQRFEFHLGKNDLKSFDVYKILRHLSSSDFGGYFNGGDFQISSSSPERFLHLKDGVLQTRPMKGTRPRGKTREDDQRLREEITHSAKDKAELLMITDLARNDLGRICEYGSVYVKDMRTIEEYKTVFQATSTVEGKLRQDKDAFDVLAACFPGGSVTGCPKIRAMDIIEELEPTRRGIYTGSLGYISFSGNMDFNILIRTLLSCQDKVYFQVGGGIVADSVPENEYEETLVKAKAMKASLAHVLSTVQH